jgi:hypothetical protein
VKILRPRTFLSKKRKDLNVHMRQKRYECNFSLNLDSSMQMRFMTSDNFYFSVTLDGVNSQSQEANKS